MAGGIHKLRRSFEILRRNTPELPSLPPLPRVSENFLPGPAIGIRAEEIRRKQIRTLGVQALNESIRQGRVIRIENRPALRQALVRAYGEHEFGVPVRDMAGEVVRPRTPRRRRKP